MSLQMLLAWVFSYMEWLVTWPLATARKKAWLLEILIGCWKKHFNTFTKVKAKGANFIYKLIDGNPLIGTNYYRLKAYNSSGEIDATKMTTQDYGLEGFHLLNVSPVPTLGNLEVVFSSSETDPVQVTVQDILGNTHLDMEYVPESGRNKLSLNLQFLTPGVYFLRIQGDTQSGFLTKVIKQ